MAALSLALWKKQIYPALLLGVWIGWWVLEGWNPLAATGSTITSIIAVFEDSGNTRIILYSLLVGSVLTLMSATGGVDGFVQWVGDRRWVTHRRRQQGQDAVGLSQSRRPEHCPVLGRGIVEGWR